MARARIHAHLEEFVDGVEAWRLTDGIEPATYRVLLFRPPAYDVSEQRRGSGLE